MAYKGHIPWNKGKTGIYSKETLLKISINTKKAMALLPPEKRALLCPKGSHRSPSTEFKKGLIPWSKGRHALWAKNLPQAYKKGYKVPLSIIEKRASKIRGANHPNWKGGITPINSSVRRSEEYKNWRRDVFIRDHFTCQKCGHQFISIVAHHIKSFAEYKELWFDVNNGITLCRSCHMKLHNPAKKVCI